MNRKKINQTYLISIIAAVIAVGIYAGCNKQNYALPCDQRGNNYQADCVFCQITEHRAPAVIVYETNDVIAFEKKPVRKPVDCLIIPKRHIPRINDLNMNDVCDKKIIDDLNAAARVLAQKLDGDQTYKTWINPHPDIMHLHMHFKSYNNWKK